MGNHFIHFKFLVFEERTPKEVLGESQSGLHSSVLLRFQKNKVSSRLVKWVSELILCPWLSHPLHLDPYSSELCESLGDFSLNADEIHVEERNSLCLFETKKTLL